VDGWLEENATAPTAETTTMDPTRTISISPGKSSEPKPEDTPAEAVDEEPMEDDGGSQKPHVPGKFAGSLKTEAASSRDAASKGLKNLFRHFG
jgi:hypothetical protein